MLLITLLGGLALLAMLAYLFELLASRNEK